MNRKWRMSCNGVQNIERDFFKFVMIDDPLISRFISIHPGIIYRLYRLHSSLDLSLSRNSILPVLSVKYVFAKESNPRCRCHLLLTSSFSFLDANASLDFVLSDSHSVTQSLSHQNWSPLIG